MGAAAVEQNKSKVNPIYDYATIILYATYRYRVRVFYTQQHYHNYYHNYYYYSCCAINVWLFLGLRACDSHAIELYRIRQTHFACCGAWLVVLPFLIVLRASSWWLIFLFALYTRRSSSARLYE